MMYKWMLEIAHQQNGEIRKIEFQESLTFIAKWEKKIIKLGWEIITLKKEYIS